MPVSHGHRPYVYNEFVPEMEAKDLLTAVELKQNLYNQGVQTIQAKMDQLSGFDIARDVDRQYANQELDKIYSLIQNNAHSDFSNPQTVKSFLDVSRPLEKDPIFRSAIDSTAELRNRQKTLDNIKTNKPNLYSESNEWDYMNDAYKWMNDKNPGTRLTKKNYSPFVNAAKRADEIRKSITPQIESEFNSTKYKGFISEEQRTFMTQEKIKNGILAGLSPQELHQLDIDARFEASKMSKEDKYRSVVSYYANMEDQNNRLGTIRGIENTGTTANEYLGNAQAIREIVSKLTDKETGTINEPYLDRLYANFYTDDWANRQGAAYAYSQTVTKWETNPFSLAAYQSTLKMKEYGSKLEMDFGQMQKTGQIIQDPKTGKWIPNPVYYQNKSRGKQAAVPTIVDMIAGSNNAFDKLPIGADGNLTPNSQVELDKDDLHASLKTAIEGLMADAGQDDPSDFGDIKLITDADGNVSVKVTNFNWGNEDFIFTQDQLIPLLGLDQLTTTPTETNQPANKSNTLQLPEEGTIFEGDTNPAIRKPLTPALPPVGVNYNVSGNSLDLNYINDIIDIANQ